MNSLPAKHLAGSTQTLAALLQQNSLADVLLQIETKVRAAPADIKLRWTLFQILCLLGYWPRALKQLQVCGRMQAGLATVAHGMRDLIRAESMRNAVFAGKARPGAMAADLPAWANGLLDALRHAADGNPAAADDARENALSSAPEVSGVSALGRFDWIADSDSRLGPTAEFIVGGMLRWCPFSELAALRIHAPDSMLELIWARVDCNLRDGTRLKGYMPARYPGSENADDALRLSRQTMWSEVGRSGVFGLGQKTWMTDGGDIALLDMRELRFDVDNSGDGPCNA
ncbi:type VI secretion system accessory protein TagJ [Collimonas silvisoli]|uniref:type VI secretion system accessory protein TagJ n=1 Tax=Collimonas silvisoli TaxID=2825884 RepID=UPI001B8C900F|nr:type VI secretion system accessory protein TagJ [Collimonas silvisoli]